MCNQVKGLSTLMNDREDTVDWENFAVKRKFNTQIKTFTQQ